MTEVSARSIASAVQWRKNTPGIIELYKTMADEVLKDPATLEKQTNYSIALAVMTEEWPPESQDKITNGLAALTDQYRENKQQAAVNFITQAMILNCRRVASLA